MIEFLTDRELTFMRRAASGRRDATAEEIAVLNDLVEKGLIHKGRLTQAGWSVLRVADSDGWMND